MSVFSRFRQAYKSRRAVRWPLDALLLLALVAAVGLFQTRRHLSDVPVPQFTLSPLGSAGAVSSSSFTGKPTMLVLWAPWCGVCKAQSDNVNRVQRWMGERARVASVALAYETKADVEAAAKAEGMEYPVLLGDAALETAFQVDAYPTVYFLDEAGRIKRSAAGYTTTFGMLWRLWL